MDSAPSLSPDLPPGFSPRRLAANLAALRAVDRPLADRLAWPVASDHVAFGPDGAAHIARRRNWLRLDVAAPAPAIDSGLPADRPGRILGVGLGEWVEAALAREPARRWVAWERDPWLLRLFLMRVDVARALRTKRLRLVLGIDALELVGRRHGPTWVHPLLGGRDARERAWIDGDGTGEVALLAEGALFVDQLGDALARRGFRPFTADVERLSEEELALTARKSGARLLFAVNYTHGLAEFSQRHGLTLIAWEVDPALDRLRPLAVAAPNAHVFTWRAAHVDEFRAAGFEHVAHLPLAADVTQRRPLELSPDEKERYAAPVAFVGSSLVAEARTQRAAFVDLVAAVRGEHLRAQGDAWLQALLDRQRIRPRTYLLDGWLKRAFPDVLAHARASRPDSDPTRWAAESAASDKRLVAIGALGRRGVHVWGDAGWKLLEEFGVRYRGPAGHQDELTRVYNGGGIHVDLGRAYQPDIVTMRVFDVLACGGFCLAERSTELTRLFEDGEELAGFDGHEDLCDKVDRYLAEPDERRRIAARGLEAVRRRHTLELRLDVMLRAALGRATALAAGAA